MGMMEVNFKLEVKSEVKVRVKSGTNNRPLPWSQQGARMTF